MLTKLLATIFANEENDSTVVPQYGQGVQEDDIDLQIRSLSYCFQRLRIDSLSPFYPEDQAGDEAPPGEGSVPLDQVYNLDKFIEAVTEEPHRILVDWCKNRARLMCILSEYPIRNVGTLPKNFKYLVLEAGSSDDVYVQKLVHESDLYHEHDIPLAWRAQCLQEIIRNQRGLLPARRSSFNKQDRWQIMIKYLSKLAEHVQIERIYKAYRKQPPSPRRLSHNSDNEPSTPTRSLKSKPSMTILRLDNSVRARSRPGSPTKMNQPNSPAIVSRSPSPRKNTTSLTTSTNININSTQNYSPLYVQATSCVTKRLEREKRKIKTSRN